tara:strand:- start:26 stop:619 length:594 start_codon:yes stop_codon:yes gene_type:complete
MGASSSGGGAGGNTGADAGFFISEKKKKQKINETNLGTSDYQGDIYKVEEPKKKNKVVEFIEGGGVTGAIIGGLTKGEEVNRKFFKEKVQPAGTSKYNTYEDYIRARGRGEVDAYGREISKSDNGGNNQPVQPVIVKKNIGGTEVQTTEAKLAEEKEIDDAYDMRKTKRRGRRQTILTSQTGARGNLVLGKPSLLGA